VQKVIQGQIVQIEPRQNDWIAVHIAIPGRQYPTKLSTKRPELIQVAQQMFGQFVDALFNEEESTSINPHSGRPYINRYLEQLGPAGAIPQPMQQPMPQQQQAPVAIPTTMMQPQVQPQPQQFGNLQPQLPPQPMPQPQPVQPQQMPFLTQSVSDSERENRIMRQAATKVAAAFIPMLDENDRNLGSLIRISEQLLRYYREGVSWETNPIGPDGQPQQPQMQGQQQLPVGAPATGYENPNEYGDPGREQGDPGEFPAGY